MSSSLLLLADPLHHLTETIPRATREVNPTMSGIFRPVARPQHGGRRELSLLLESDALTDAHALGEVTVIVVPALYLRFGARLEALAAGEHSRERSSTPSVAL